MDTPKVEALIDDLKWALQTIGDALPILEEQDYYCVDTESIKARYEKIKASIDSLAVTI